MSVRLNPCFGCPIFRGQKRDACAIRNEYRAKIAGLWLRSATFNCPTLAAKLKPGVRIKVRHPMQVESGSEYQEFDIQLHDLPATITTSKNNEFSCVVDRDAILELIEDDDKEGIATVDKYRFRKTMRHSRVVAFLDEPPREICSGGNPINPDTLVCDRRPGDGYDECVCQTHKRHGVAA